MANTIMSAKNSFEQGLIMDFAPDNTQANCLTSALNATLLTFNGNEMSLQNDMGNGRVETARLPEGYIPIGTCEFGDIIYIVSYNPIIDKALIGCFPSPERNISSAETFGLKQSLKNSEFLEIGLDNNPTGKLKTRVIKKVLINKGLNPGDKYIVYNGKEELETIDYSTLFNNVTFTNSDNKASSYLKLSIVSIAEDGKITDLTNTAKLYVYNKGTDDEYSYIINTMQKNNEIADLDSYRSVIDSAWSIFTSKISGLLAILAELIAIDKFSCGVRVDLKDSDTYELVITPSWEGEVDLTNVCVSVSENNKFTYKSDNYVARNDDKVYTVVKKNEDIVIGQYKNPEGISTITVTPAMPYGKLEEMTIEENIDFSKIGTGIMEMSDWRYYCDNEKMMLTYSIDAYPKPGNKITSIDIKLYDNSGLTGVYTLKDQSSYTGVFTEYLGLDGNLTNRRFSRYDSEEDKEEKEKFLIQHKGEKEEYDKDKENKEYTDNGSYYSKKDKEGNWVLETFEENGKTYVYTNDSGKLYSGFLYLAKIIIHQQKRDAKAEEDVTLYRWLWTNPMFNEYYSKIADFDTLQFELALDSSAVFVTNPKNYVWKNQEINNLDNDFTENSRYLTYSANVLYIGKYESDNIDMYVNAGLLDNFGCFNLHGGDEGGEGDHLNDINLEIFMGPGTILYLDNKDFQFSYEDTNISELDYLKLEELSFYEGDGSENFKYLDTPINTNSINIQDSFNITFGSVETGHLETVNLEKEETELLYETQKYEGTLKDCYISAMYSEKKSIPLTLKAALFNKAYTQSEYETQLLVPVYEPIINTLLELSDIGITYQIKNTNEIRLGFDIGIALNLLRNEFTVSVLNQNDLNFDNMENALIHNSSSNVNTATSQEFIEDCITPIYSRLPLFFPIYLGGHRGGGDHTDYLSVMRGNLPKNPANITNWQESKGIGNYQVLSAITGDQGSGTFNNEGDGYISDVDINNHATILGVKYKEGITALNTAMVDTFEETSINNKYQFKQLENRQKNGNLDGGFDNFAYLLYLILSNTYHKNKRAADNSIRTYNCVRLGDRITRLTKNIIIKLSPKETTHNIIMNGLSFLEYLEDIYKNSSISEDAIINDSNVTLKFLDCAKNNLLQIDVNNNPMSFLNLETNAYILRNGNLIKSDILSDLFYIYLNGKLLVFLDDIILLFKANEVNDNIKYILKLEYGTLIGAKGSKVDNGEDLLLKDMKEYITTYNFEKYFYTNKPEAEAVQKLFVYYILPEAMIGKGYDASVVYNFISYQGLDWFKIETRFVNNLTEYYLLINISNMKEARLERSNIYKITPHLVLNNGFEYNNGLSINASNSRNYFCITDIHHAHGFLGFIKDMILDKNYQVL